MTLKDFLAQVKDLPPDTLICVAEMDEAFAANIAEVEVVDSAEAESTDADGTEAVNLSSGKSKAVVIRW